MSEHTLPEDPADWPDDPHELLGVPEDAGERDLRRAYARLIRLYKPEHSPEQFRRIRAAYESAREYAAYRGPAEESPDGEPPPPQENDAPGPFRDPAPFAPAEERPPQRPARSFDEELEEAWDGAVAGDEARAYARLLELRERHPGRQETYLRLYGLLGAAPELDDRRGPCDFLAEGLRQSGGGGPCYELYGHEIDDCPGEALSERFAGVMAATAKPGLLAALAGWRWTAAGRLGRFEVIGGDLPGLRARLGVGEDETWLRLLVSAADVLAWAPAGTDPGLAECLAEAAALTHLHLSCSDVYDRLEVLERAASGWHALVRKGTVPAGLLRLLARAWARPASAVRRDVMALVAAVADDPGGWLGHLDRVREASPELLSHFGDVIQTYRWSLPREDDDRDEEERAGLARQFLEENGGLLYTKALRPRLLAFCLREHVDPEVVADAAARGVVELPEARLDKLVNDWPLRYLYRAWALAQG